MSAWLLLTISVLYLGAAVGYVMDGKPAMCAVLVCYALANVFLAMLGRG